MLALLPLALLLGAPVELGAGAPAPAPIANAEAQETCSARWRVEVVDSDTGEGVPEASVELRPLGQQSRVAKTDASGVLLVAGLCEGRMQVSVAKSEHQRASERIEIAGAETLSVIGLAPLHDHHSAQVSVAHGDAQSSMASSESLAGAELAETRGEGLAGAISKMSGVTSLRGTAGGMAKPVIRGQVGRRNLVIFDRVRHEGQKWGLDHAPEVDADAAGRITVIKGAATTRFGPDAIGGVVLVDPRPMLRSPGVAGELSLVGSSNALGGGGAFRLDHAPRRARGLSWRVEGKLGRHRALVTPDYALDNTGAYVWKVGGRLAYLSERIDVVTGYHLLRARAGICSCLRVSTPEEFESGLINVDPVGVELYTADFAIERPRQEIWHHLALARSRIDLGAGGELHVSYAFQFNDREEYDAVRDSISGPQLQLGLATHTAQLRYEHAAVELSDGWSLIGTVGGELNNQANQFEAANTLIPDYRQRSGGVFVVEQFVSERVEVELGARYAGVDRKAALSERDYLGQSASGRLDAQRCVETEAGGARCRQDFHAPSGTLGLRLHPFRAAPELGLRFGLNSSARTPAIDESFMNGAAPSFPILGLGDSRLGVERTWGGSMGLSYLGDRLRVEASDFVNYIDDYIYFKPEPQQGQCAPLSCTSRGPFPLYVFEAIDALFVGGELRFDLRMSRLPFEISADGSWVRGWDAQTDTALSMVPADRYGLRGRWLWPDTRFSARGYLELGGTFVARQRRFDPDADFSLPPSSYVLLGAGAGVEFPLEDALLRLSLRGTNLLNQRYREYTSLLRYFADEPGWGLQLRAGVTF